MAWKFSMDACVQIRKSNPDRHDLPQCCAVPRGYSSRTTQLDPGSLLRSIAPIDASIERRQPKGPLVLDPKPRWILTLCCFLRRPNSSRSFYCLGDLPIQLPFPRLHSSCQLYASAAKTIAARSCLATCASPRPRVPILSIPCMVSPYSVQSPGNNSPDFGYGVPSRTR